MKTPLRFLTLLAALALAATSAQAQITVGNVRATQRAGTMLVDIDYDLTDITTPVTVRLEISADAGSTWSVPATTLTGAVGPDVAPGPGLRITWNAGADWNNQASTQTRCRLTVSDLLPYGAEFALIPAGEFTMGDSLDGMGDAPPHPVSVSAFYMQKKGVTEAEWDTVRAWGLSHGYSDLAAGAGKGADHPVQTVSWYDALKWCNARSEMNGLIPCYYTDAPQTAVFKTGSNNLDSTLVKWTANGYRLPTSAEWEKAARGGLVGKRFTWGNTISHANANFQNWAGESYQTGTTGYHPTYATGGYPFTSPAGSFPANSYGIFDMTGNMWNWNWTWDWYDAAYYGTSPAHNPQGPASGPGRVIRGGDWSSAAYVCRVAELGYRSPDFSGNYVGFRPVRAATLASAGSPDFSVDTHVWVTLTLTATHGTVSGAGRYALNSTVELAATPDPGYLFREWTGDATGSTNPLSVLLDSNKSIGAAFIEDSRDPDGDGLANYQELAVYGSNPAVADTDRDGFSDGYEVNHGFSPVSPDSSPDTQMVIDTAVEVSFGAGLGKSYRIESSTDLQTWTTVEEHIAGTGGMIARFYSVREIPKRYFRSVRE